MEARLRCFFKGMEAIKSRLFLLCRGVANMPPGCKALHAP
jgi:hypothetical protein